MWKSSVYTGLLIVFAAGVASCDKSSPTEPTPGPCSYTLSASSLTFGASGGTGSVNVTTASQCAWTAVSDRGWMSITSGSNGTGNGVVNVSLTPYDPAGVHLDGHSRRHGDQRRGHWRNGSIQRDSAKRPLHVR